MPYSSNTEKINLDWLRLHIYGILILWGIIFWRNDDYTFSFIAIFIFSIGYFGIKQVGVFNDHFTIQNADLSLPLSVDTLVAIDEIDKKDTEIVAKKYQKSSLNHEVGIKIQEELQKLMMNEKSFLNPELTLGDVATKLNIHPNTLSQVINTFEQKNFYDFINSLRIEEFKKLAMIENNQKITLLSLALDCGFNSKATFNRWFKKETNQTPTEYLNLLKQKST